MYSVVIPFDKPDWKFPPVEQAGEDGLLVIGGQLSVQKVLEAYHQGIFPWYSQYEPVLWWSPDPRCVLFPGELHVSSSMKKLMRQKKYHFTTNLAFEDVIVACKTIDRKDQEGTWITDEIEEVYTELFEMGLAHSAETWLDNQLVGGMYGIRIGNVYFGESMFSLQPNASKFAFISHARQLQSEGVELIDCQVHTPHLESLGARMIPRREFVALLEKLC